MPRRPFYSLGYAFGALAFFLGAALHATAAYHAFRLGEYGRFSFDLLGVPFCLFIARALWRSM